jgi:hypothetical protein
VKPSAADCLDERLCLDPCLAKDAAEGASLDLTMERHNAAGGTATQHHVNARCRTTTKPRRSSARMASVPEMRGSSGNVSDVERGDHWPRTERQRKLFEVERSGPSQVAERLLLGLTLRGRTRLGVQRTETSLGRGPQDCCQFDGVTGGGHVHI